MFTIDIPYVPALEAPIILAQSVSSGAAGSAPKMDYLFTECQDIPVITAPSSAERFVDMQQALANYLENKGKVKQPIDIAAIKIVMIANTQRGKLVDLVGPRGERAWRYDPQPGYVGKERAVFVADYGGRRYKIVLTINANDFYTNGEGDTECPPPRMIKLKANIDKGSIRGHKG